MGYYFVVTDTKETEKNYLTGLRDSLPERLQGRIVIKVSSTKTSELITACEQADVDPQYRQCWIVFDRDQVAAFDKIIGDAKSKGIQVGWSNPCVEIWFDAYFGKMPTVQDSVSCWKGFAAQKTGQEYEKANQHIYAALKKLGDEAGAIKLAENCLQAHVKEGKTQPSKMCPGTTLHHLVDEIRKKAMQ